MFRGFAGTIVGGVVKPGDRVRVLPSGRRTPPYNASRHASERPRPGRHRPGRDRSRRRGSAERRISGHSARKATAKPMISDFDALPDESCLDNDVCVVGGGAVGLAMATALAQQGVRVLVLEGGGTRLELESQALQKGRSIGHPFSSIDTGRYRVLGGTTLFWGGQLYPFDSFVVGARDWVGHAAWPISDTELEPWVTAAYRQLGLGNAILDDAAVWPAIGHERPDFGPDIQVVTTRYPRVRNFARLFSTALHDPKGVRVLTHANVVGLRMDASRRRVESLRVQSLRGRACDVRVGNVALANGSLEIARLMLHPLADGAPTPWAASRWLGAPLMDHLNCTAGEVEVLDYHGFHDIFDYAFTRGLRYWPRLRMAPASQRRDNSLDIAAHFLYQTRFTEHLDHLYMFWRSLREGGVEARWLAMPGHLLAVAATTLPLVLRYFGDRRSFKPRSAKVSLGLSCEQLPCERSRLMLGSERDALGLRRLRVDWQIRGAELESMRRFARIVRDQLALRGLARVRLHPALEALDPSFLTRIQDAIHHMGTARMGRDPDEGLVDSNLRVFGTENLYVAGASVFPSAGFANPTLTAIALALRLAGHLAGNRAVPA
jgi:hypothetical protein